jgi:hypothetical protein
MVIIALHFFIPLAFFKSNKAIFFQGGWLPALLIIIALEMWVCSLCFFLIERHSRNCLIPVIYPRGGLASVSGHGIPSALLTATGRALIRQRIALPGSLASVANDVNRQLAADLEVSGRFMTMLFLRIETFLKKTAMPRTMLRWLLLKSSETVSVYADLISEKEVIL